MPGEHPYLVGKSEGAAVLAAARAAQNFAPAQASGPVIIAGISQGGHAAIWSGYQAQSASYFAPGIDVRGIIALSPPTELAKIAKVVLADKDPDPAAVMNLLIVVGSWSRLYGLEYPTDVLAKESEGLSADLTDPQVLPSAPCINPAGTIDPKSVIQGEKIGREWNDLLVMNSAPTAFLDIPLLVVQAVDDNQVPFRVTLSAMRQACADKVLLTFDEMKDGGHLAPIMDARQVDRELKWAQTRLRGKSVENSCKWLIRK
jgi:hypothetical protein